MNSVQENKNELEAAVRYCESAITRAKQTIESMEFRQQAATKAWHEQTGREEALQREVADLKLKNEELKTNMALITDEIEELKKRNGELRIQLVEWRDRSMGYTKEIGELKSEVAEFEQSEQDLKQANMGLVCDNDDLKDEITDLKVKQQKMEQTMQLQKDQIAMFQRKMSRMNEVDR